MVFCQLACSPNQAKFIKPAKIVKNEYNEDTVTAVDYYLVDTFALGVYDSCKDVISIRGRILEQTCGDNCTYLDWFYHIGLNAQTDGMAPYQINFQMVKEKEMNNKVFENQEPLNEKFFKCSEAPSKFDERCNCEDCPSACSQKSNRLTEKADTRRAKRDAGTCIMRGVCGETAFGAIPCAKNDAPGPISDPEALEELKEMCPHLVTGDQPTVCCTEDQIIRLNQTFEMVAMFLKDCPSCVRNFEKVICHLSCATDQATFMKITKTEKNDGEFEMVKEVDYYVNEDWAKGIYDSCKGVSQLGFNVLDHYCKPHKAKDCDHKKFLSFIGADAEHFGHSPFEINFIFSNEDKIDAFTPVKQTHYKCSDDPHTGEGKCPCMHCKDSCAEGEAQPEPMASLPKFAPKAKRYALLR